MLDDDGRRRVHEIPENVQGIVRIGHIGFSGMFSGLKQFDVGCQVLARLDGPGFPENQIAVDQLKKRRFLPGILAVSQAFLLAFDIPEDFFIKQGLAAGFVDKADFHARREMLVHDGFIHFFQVVCHSNSP